MGSTAKRLSHGIDLDLWTAMIAAHRKTPGNFTRVAGECGTTRRTVRRLWNEGLPRYPWGARPMRELLLDEQRASTAKAAEAAKVVAPELVAEGRRLAIETRADEAKHLRFARANVQGLLNATTQLTASALKLAQKIDQTLDDPEFAKGLNLAQSILTISRMAGIVTKGIYAAESCASLERMILGDPKDRAGFEGDEREMTPEEALEEVSRAVDLAGRLERKGLRVLAGGRGRPAPEGAGADVGRAPVSAPPPEPEPVDERLPSPDDTEEEDDETP